MLPSSAADMDPRGIDVKPALEDLERGLVLLRHERREDMVLIRAEINAFRADLSSMRSELHTQFRWIMGGIAWAVVCLLVALLSATLVIVNRS